MSDNKKYYYLKFKENYFDQDHIKVIESMQNGHTYSLIILKLYLKALKFEGQLKLNDAIPYMSNKIDMLAGVINHDPDHVSKAITIAKDLGVIDIMSTGEMFMSDIQNFIGHGSTESERKAEYRKKIEAKKLLQIEYSSMGQCPGQVPPELELDIEKELEKDIDPYIITDKKDTKSLTYTEKIKEIISYLNSSLGEKGKKYRNVEGNAKHIRARLNEGYTVDDFKKVIDNKKLCPYFQKNPLYYRPETLFSPKFEGYLNERAGSKYTDEEYRL